MFNTVGAGLEGQLRCSRYPLSIGPEHCPAVANDLWGNIEPWKSRATCEQPHCLNLPCMSFPSNFSLVNTRHMHNVCSLKDLGLTYIRQT